MSIKEFFLDVETTGLDSQKNGIWQIGGIVYIDGVEEVRIYEDMALQLGLEYNPKTLEFLSMTKEEIESFQNPVKVYNKLIGILKTYINPYNKQDKFYLYGYNVRFDTEFLRQFFKNFGDSYFGSYFWFPPLDVMNLAMEKLKKERPVMTNFKQFTVAKALGIELDEDRLHDALYDIELSREIYQKLQD